MEKNLPNQQPDNKHRNASSPAGIPGFCAHNSKAASGLFTAGEPLVMQKRGGHIKPSRKITYGFFKIHPVRRL